MVKNTVDTSRIKKLSKNDDILIGYIDGMTTPGGINLPELARWQFYGTKNIPARPFLEDGINQNKAAINKAIESHYKKVAQDNNPDIPGLWKILAVAISGIKKMVIDGFYKQSIPNAPSTIYAKSHRQKGKTLVSDTPLIDDGSMINSLTGKVNGKVKS